MAGAWSARPPRSFSASQAGVAVASEKDAVWLTSHVGITVAWIPLEELPGNTFVYNCQFGSVGAEGKTYTSGCQFGSVGADGETYTYGVSFDEQ